MDGCAGKSAVCAYSWVTSQERYLYAQIASYDAVSVIAFGECLAAVCRGQWQRRCQDFAVDVSEFGALGTLTIPRGGPRRIAADVAGLRVRLGGGGVIFVGGYVASRGGSSSESFEARHTSTDSLGQVHVRMTQSIAGLPVVGAELIVHADAKTGNVLGVNGRFAPDRDLPRQATVGAGAAIDYAAGAYGMTRIWWPARRS